MNSKILGFYFLIFAIGFQTAQSQNCQQHQVEAENLIRILLRIDKEEMIAITTDKQFSEYCKKAKEGLAMFKNYGSCLTGIGKQVFLLLKAATSKAYRNYCVIEPQSTKDHLACFADTKLTVKYRKCLSKINQSLSYAAEAAEDSEIFSSVCCGFNLFSSCLDEAFKTNGKFCTDSKMNLLSFSKKLFKNLFGSVTESFCSNYDSNFCKNEMGVKIEKFMPEQKLSLPKFSVIKNVLKLSEKLSA